MPQERLTTHLPWYPPSWCPGGPYGRDQNASLTSRPFSLAGFESARLQFDCAHDLEINFDKVHLEIRGGGEADAPESAI